MATTGPAAEAEAMRTAGFADIESRTFLADHAWTIEEVAGYLRTTSVCSRRILGGRQAAFEAALRDLLLAIQPVGELREQLDFGYTVGRRPD